MCLINQSYSIYSGVWCFDGNGTSLGLRKFRLFYAHLYFSVILRTVQHQRLIEKQKLNSFTWNKIFTNYKVKNKFQIVKEHNPKQILLWQKALKIFLIMFLLLWRHSPQVNLNKFSGISLMVDVSLTHQRISILV